MLYGGKHTKQADKIRSMLLDGKTNKEISTELGCTRSVVSYHSIDLGLSKPRARGSLKNWKQIAKFYETHTRAETFVEFNLGDWDWNQAQCRGDITSRGFDDIRTSWEDILVENSTYDNSSLKCRIMKENILPNICVLCGQLPEHNGMALVLQLDHINGINNDNRIENLRILCPNCHTQTDTWGRKDRTKTEP